MVRPNIMLTEGEVPLRAEVYLYVSENDVPEEMDGSPMVFRAMLGGVPQRKKLYHMKGGEPIAGLEGFDEGIRFSPVEVYSQGNAQIGRCYAVFVSGKRIFEEVKYGRIPCEVTKSSEGEIVDSAHFPFKMINISGIPVFEFEMRRFEQCSDTDLTDALEANKRYMENLEALRSKLDERMVKDAIQNNSQDRVLVLEALGRRHRGSDIPGLINIIRPLVSEYLIEAQLPDDAELVPLC